MTWVVECVCVCVVCVCRVCVVCVCRVCVRSLGLTDRGHAEVTYGGGDGELSGGVAGRALPLQVAQAHGHCLAKRC